MFAHTIIIHLVYLLPNISSYLPAIICRVS